MLIPIGFLRPDPTNPRIQVNIDALAESIRAFGVRSPVVVNKRTGVIEAGHQRVDALKKLGAQHAPVLWADDDGAMARAFMIADNRVGEVVAAWDDDGLAALLNDMVQDDDDLIESLGFDEEELARLLEKNGISGDEASDDLPETEAAKLMSKWGVEPGQMWALGAHRILCGDCTDAAAVARLMENDRAALVVTDPPYGVSYVSKLDAMGGEKKHKPIAGDDLSGEDLSALWRGAWRTMLPFLSESYVYYICSPQGVEFGHQLQASLLAEGIPLRHQLIWAKNRLVLGRSDYHYQHEPILYGWGNRHDWYGDRSQTSLWEIDVPHRSKEHPTMKPVELYLRAIRNSSKEGDVVYEPFSGSGTCIVACEELGRVCRAVEVEPGYVAVSLERWSLQTSGVPELLP